MSPDPVVARWWHAEGERLRCELCPRACLIGEGQAGSCCVRRNSGGQLHSLSYGQPTGFAVDPIEKKPLFHFLPGTRVLSFGTLGCTLRCRFCQNWPHSHPEAVEMRARHSTPEEIVALAKQEAVPSIAYTYNEPTVFSEYLIDTARAARSAGLRNVAVSNGYITPQARREVFAELDAANIDLKGFSEDFYRDLTGGSLQPVLDTLVWIRRETEIWLEVTTLLIPGLNDDDEMLAAECDWITAHLGTEVPVHFTAFHPDFKLRDRPPTPPETLARARDLARAKGLRYVYVGNVAGADGLHTYCPECAQKLITRGWHAAETLALQAGRCTQCGAKIAGVFA